MPREARNAGAGAALSPNRPPGVKLDLSFDTRSATVSYFTAILIPQSVFLIATSLMTASIEPMQNAR